MTWYNPFNLLGRKNEDVSLYRGLICASPKCGREITKGPVVYDRIHQETYHQGDCHRIAISDRLINRPIKALGRPRNVSLSKALELLEEGKIKKFKVLEERV